MTKIKKIEKVPTVWIKIPIILIKNYSKLPEKFKLKDIEKVCRKPNGKPFHRNTYQNWLNFLRKVGIVELQGRKYVKTQKKISEGASSWIKKIVSKYE